MGEVVISGLQQIGIGNPNVYETWKWYRENFGYDIKLFEEANVARIMLPYTGGKPQQRHAIFAMNLQGGGGFEIWQYTKRTPLKPLNEIQLGDFGIFAAKIKSKNVEATFSAFKFKNLDVLGTLEKDPLGNDHFYVRDPNGNIFNIISSDKWFKDENKLMGGTAGAVIGVSDIETSKKFYKDILGYDLVLFEGEDEFNDFSSLNGGKLRCKRAILTHSLNREGAFSNILGSSIIELVQVLERKQNKIFEGRFWGDLGFIHLCYDINGFDTLREICKEKGYPFTVDSANHHKETFDMGEAAGHFSYIEDPDGTLIEFVETHKVPILKKLGIYMNLKKRNPRKPLPNWMLKAMSFNRFKDKN